MLTLKPEFSLLRLTHKWYGQVKATKILTKTVISSILRKEVNVSKSSVKPFMATEEAKCNLINCLK